MAGLLPTDIDDPRNQGLLGAALAMLAASGPSPQRRTFGQILGGAGIQGMQQYDQARVLRQRDEENKRRNALMDLQMKKFLSESQMKQDALAAAKQKEASRLAFLEQLSTPQYPLGTTVVSTDPSKQPQNVQPQTPRLNPLQAVRAGFTLDEASKMAEAPNWGRPAAAHWQNVAGPGGAPEVAGFTKFGDPLRTGMQAYTDERDPVAAAQKSKRAALSAPQQTFQLPGQKPFWDELGKGQAGRVNEAFTRRNLARSTEAFVNQMEALHNTGMQGGGPLQGWLQMIQGTAQQLGIKYDPTKLAVDQATQQQVAKEIWNQMANNPAVKQMSNQDRQAFERTIINQDMNPESRRMAFQMVRNQIARDVALGNAVEKRVTDARLRGDDMVIVDDLFGSFDTKPVEPYLGGGPKKQPQERKTLRGKSYVKIDGEWYEE